MTRKIASASRQRRRPDPAAADGGGGRSASAVERVQVQLDPGELEQEGFRELAATMRAAIEDTRRAVADALKAYKEQQWMLLKASNPRKVLFFFCKVRVRFLYYLINPRMRACTRLQETYFDVRISRWILSVALCSWFCHRQTRWKEWLVQMPTGFVTGNLSKNTYTTGRLPRQRVTQPAVSGHP